VAVSTIGVADATSPDKYLWTEQRTVSSTAREAQVVLEGEGVYPTYSVVAYSIAMATADSHLLQVMGDGSNYTRIKRIIVAPGGATALGIGAFQVLRLSSAGTGGATLTPSPYDTADTYAGGAMSLPSSKGTEGVLVHAGVAPMSSGTVPNQLPYTWEPSVGGKPIILGPATSDGIVIKNMTALSGGTGIVVVEFITTSFL